MKKNLIFLLYQLFIFALPTFHGCMHRGINEPDGPPPLNSPCNLWITSLSDTSLLLNWRDYSNANNFIIERAQVNQPFYKIENISNAGMSFIDSNLKRSTVYSYRIKSIRDNDTSLYSATLTVRFSPSNKLLRNIQGKSNVGPMALSPDGKLLVAYCSDSTINIWNTSDWSLKTFPDHNSTKNINTIAITGNSQLMVLGGFSKIKVIRLSDGLALHTIDIDSVYISDLDVTPDGSQIIASDSKGKIRIWNINDGSLVRLLDSLKDDSWYVTISPDGNNLIACSYLNMKIWDLNSCTIVKQIFGHHSSPVYNKSGKVLSVNNSDVLINYNTDNWTIICSYNRQVFYNTFSPKDSIQLLGDGNLIHVGKVFEGTIIRTISGYSSTVVFISFLPDGNSFITYSRDNVIVVWSTSLVDQWNIVP